MTHAEAIEVLKDCAPKIRVTPLDTERPHVLRLNQTNYDIRALDELTLRLVVAQNEH